MCRHKLSLAKFGPGLSHFGIAVAFAVSVVVAPHVGPGASMESYPMQCTIVEIGYGGLVIAGTVVIARVAAVFLASVVTRPGMRAVSIVAGFVGLAIVMAFGAE